jgi:hypothetical protein
MKLIGEGAALGAFHSALAAAESVPKSEIADMGKFQVKYASLNAVAAECERVCQMFKLEFCQEPTVVDGLFAVLTTLIHEDGSRVEFEPMCLPLPKEAQALGSATTYLRRYSLVSLFRLAVADDDGAAATIAAQTQPGRRTEAERLIRESIGQMDDASKAAFTLAFKEHFRSTLSDLPVARHGDALTWARAWSQQRSEDVAEAPEGPVAPTSVDPASERGAS